MIVKEERPGNANHTWNSMIFSQSASFFLSFHDTGAFPLMEPLTGHQ